MQVTGDAPEALSNEDIIRQYDSALSQIIQAASDPHNDFERTILLNAAKLNWLFCKGQHFSVPGIVTTPLGDIADYMPWGGTSDEETGADIKLCPPINVIGGDLYKYMAVMGQNAPRVKALPDDVKAPGPAKTADVNLRDLWVKNRIDRKWKAIPFHQYVTGPAFIRSFWNTDKRKYGHSVEPKIEIVDGPDGNPVPQITGEQTYANGDAELSIHSVLDVSIPFDAKELCGWLKFEAMLSKWSLLSRFKGTDEQPGPLEKYRTGDVPDDDLTADSNTAAEVRDAVSMPSGTGRTRKAGFWRFREYWIDPQYIEACESSEARKILGEHFSDGLYIAKVGSITVEVDNRKETDEWSVARVGRGEKIIERPICADSMPISRAIDDLFGMAIETVLRAITKTIVDNSLLNREALNNNEAVPSEFVFTVLPVDGDINKRIAQIPPIHLSDQVRPLLEFARGLMQDITGIRPELSGGGQPTQTYREAKQRRDQALQQLSPQAQELQYAAEDVGTNLVKLRSKFGSGTVKAQRRGAYGIETDVADMAELKDGGWYAEADDNWPMTAADSRDSVFSLLKDFPPEVQQALSILDPLNIEELFDLLQVPGFESAVRDQVDKTLNDIEKLLQEQPIPGQPGPDGKPGPDEPSFQPPAYENHIVSAGVSAKWLISKAGQKAEIENPGGFGNVVAYQAKQQIMATPPLPPPPPPIKASLGFAGKLEDFPSLVPELLQGAGLPAPQPNATDAAMQAAPPLAAPPDMGPPAPIQQESPIPPVGGPPSGPEAPTAVQ
jgi:hypothetical protein